MNELDALKAEASAAIAAFNDFGAKITADGYVCTADEAAQFDALENDARAKREAFEAEIAKVESQSHRDERLNRLKAASEWSAKIEENNYRAANYGGDDLFRSANQDDDFAMVLAAWARMGCEASNGISQREADAAARLGMNPAAGKLGSRNPDILRAYARHAQNVWSKHSSANVILDFEASSATDPLDSRSGDRAGYLNRAPEYLSTLERNMIAFGGILQAPITIMVTDHYEDVEETYADDNSNKGVQSGERQTIGTTVNPQFKKIVWKYYDYTSNDVQVTNRQLERSRFGLPDFINLTLGERLGRIQAEVFTIGAGAVNPQGIVTACTAGGSFVETQQSLKIGYDDIVLLEESLDPTYNGYGPSVGYMFHPKTRPLLRLIKDGDGKPVFSMGAEGSNINSPTLMGRPVFFSNEMAKPSASFALTAGQKIMLFGDVSRFVVRRAGGGMPRFIRDETTLRRSEQTLFTALLSVDSRLRNYGAAPLSELRVKA